MSKRFPVCPNFKHCSAVQVGEPSSRGENVTASAPPRAHHQVITSPAALRPANWGIETVPVLSLTVTQKLYIPLAIGVPEMAPVAGLRVKPGGSDPSKAVQLP